MPEDPSFHSTGKVYRMFKQNADPKIQIAGHQASKVSTSNGPECKGRGEIIMGRSI